MTIQDPHQRLAEIAFFLLAATALLFRSHTGSPLNHDEITYLQMAREMVSSGNFLDLTFQGEVVHQRPPLAIWLLAISGSLLDFSLLAGRLPAILMALSSLAALAAIGRHLFGCRTTGLLAAALLLASQLFYFNARRPMTDMTFVAGMLLFFLAFLRARHNPRWYLAAGLAAGWMVMTKNIVTAIPLAIAGTELLLSPRRLELRSPWLWAGAALALALAAPWHLAQWARHGNSFWAEYVGFNMVARASSSLFAEPDPLFYARTLWEEEGMLAVAAAAAALALLVRFARNRAAPDRLLLLWLLLAALPFQLSSTRLSHYLMPLVPALALAVAAAAAPLLTRPLLKALAFLVVAGFFANSNLPHLLSPDYSPDQQRFARQIAPHLLPGSRVLALNHYELSLFYELQRPVTMVTDSPRFFAIVDSAPIMHRTGSVELLTIDQLRARLDRRPFFCLTTPAHLPLLCGVDGRACADGGPYRVERGHQLVLIMRRGD